jgi:hypothetical protein
MFGKERALMAAYQRVFKDSPDAQIVLRDLAKHLYSAHPQDTLYLADDKDGVIVRAALRDVWDRIMFMLNAPPGLVYGPDFIQEPETEEGELL